MLVSILGGISRHSPGGHGAIPSLPSLLISLALLNSFISSIEYLFSFSSLHMPIRFLLTLLFQLFIPSTFCSSFYFFAFKYPSDYCAFLYLLVYKPSLLSLCFQFFFLWLFNSFFILQYSGYSFSFRADGRRPGAGEFKRNRNLHLTVACIRTLVAHRHDQCWPKWSAKSA